MAIAIALLLIVIGSVLFHWLAPWWTTPLASNWQRMDDTLAITLAITGLFFVVINLFIVYTLLRFRHREGQRAAYQPDNKRLEHWLIGVTTIGIIALLAPGLVVYADYVRPPHDAMVLEVVGQQWQWRYRFAGAGGEAWGQRRALRQRHQPTRARPCRPGRAGRRRGHWATKCICRWASRSRC